MSTTPARPTETAEIRAALATHVREALFQAPSPEWSFRERYIGREAAVSTAVEAIVARPLATIIAERDAALAERDEAQDLAYQLKLAAAGGEDVPGSGHTVTVEDVNRWRVEASQREEAATAQAERTAGELAAAKARIAVLEAELSKRPPRHSPDFPCPKCGVRRGMFPACAQDGCPLLDRNGKPFARAALTEEIGCLGPGAGGSHERG